MEAERYPCCIAPVDTTFLREKPLIGGETLTDEKVLYNANAKELSAVKRLNLWSCDLSVITVLNKLPNLEVCSISSNFIDSLKDFTNCKNLRELFVRNNSISNLGELCYLKNLTKLRVLWIHKNPISLLENYRYTVLRTLPNLEKLDNTEVTPVEVEMAMTKGFDICTPKEPSPSIRQDIPNFSNWREAIKHSIEEVNKVRTEHGLKPLSVESLLPDNRDLAFTHGTERDDVNVENTHILQAVLQLIKELDEISLKLVGRTIDKRLEAIADAERKT